MTALSETDMLALVDGAKRVFLLEPDYRRKYPPLGLMKIASRVRARGGVVKYGRHYLGEKCDLICVTSLFTYESPKVIQAVRQALALGNGTPVIVGGIYASLMRKHLLENTEGKALVFSGYSRELDMSIPDYDSIDWKVEKPWDDFSFVFTSRGCTNKCAYCAVPRIEAKRWVNPIWREHIVDSKPNVIVGDNNILACGKHAGDVIGHLSAKGKGVVIDSGVEAKLITKETAALLAALQFKQAGLRLAFDRVEEDREYRDALAELLRAGVSSSHMMTFVLFNFLDTPREADYRMRVTYAHHVRPFPQRYQRLNQTTRAGGYVGKHWTHRLACEFRVFWTRPEGIKKGSLFESFMKKRRRALGFTDEDFAKWDLEKDRWDTRPWWEMRETLNAEGLS